MQTSTKTGNLTSILDSPRSESGNGSNLCIFKNGFAEQRKLHTSKDRSERKSNIMIYEFVLINKFPPEKGMNSVHSISGLIGFTVPWSPDYPTQPLGRVKYPV